MDIDGDVEHKRARDGTESSEQQRVRVQLAWLAHPAAAVVPLASSCAAGSRATLQEQQQRLMFVLCSLPLVTWRVNASMCRLLPADSLSQYA